MASSTSRSGRRVQLRSAAWPGRTRRVQGGPLPLSQAVAQPVPPGRSDRGRQPVLHEPARRSSSSARSAPGAWCPAGAAVSTRRLDRAPDRPLRDWWRPGSGCPWSAWPTAASGPRRRSGRPARPGSGSPSRSVWSRACICPAAQRSRCCRSPQTTWAWTGEIPRHHGPVIRPVQRDRDDGTGGWGRRHEVQHGRGGIERGGEVDSPVPALVAPLPVAGLTEVVVAAIVDRPPGQDRSRLLPPGTSGYREWPRRRC